MIEMMSKPIKVAVLNFEAEELIALMWAVETATEGQGDDISESAWAAHQRIQEAWKALIEAK
jgi:hypothetical protein